MTTPHMGRPLRVLLVDDARAVREALRELLTDIGVDVAGEASSGEEAVAVVELLRPDVVLMDLRMPGMTGLEATRAIRHAIPEVRVVIVSAYDDETLREAAAAAGASGYVVKGRPAAMLLERITDVAGAAAQA